MNTDVSRLVEVRLESWESYLSIADGLDAFVFRGQSDYRWPLSTTFERNKNKHDSSPILPRHSQYWMLHEFKRKFHLYASEPPNIKDHFEWLAIMQHHGSPTRLLDFTYSFALATYFAIVDATSDASVWAINHWRTRKILHELFGLPYEIGQTLKDEINELHIDLANKIIGDRNVAIQKRGLIPLEPRQLTARMSRQQGLFLMPTDRGASFTENLCSLIGVSIEENKPLPIANSVSFKDYLHSSLTFTEKNLPLESIDFTELQIENPSDTPYFLIKFVLPISEHPKIIKHLTRMNITGERLFPDIDGLSRSLGQTVIRYY